MPVQYEMTRTAGADNASGAVVLGFEAANPTRRAASTSVPEFARLFAGGEMDSNLYGAFGVKRLFLVFAGSLFGGVSR